jgi:hypothetical protein
MVGEGEGVLVELLLLQEEWVREEFLHMENVSVSGHGR